MSDWWIGERLDPNGAFSVLPNQKEAKDLTVLFSLSYILTDDTELTFLCGYLAFGLTVSPYWLNAHILDAIGGNS